VRHGLLHLVLDVPDDARLGAQGPQAAKWPRHLFETNRQTARETVSFAAGQCVG